MNSILQTASLNSQKSTHDEVSFWVKLVISRSEILLKTLKYKN